MIGNRPGCNQFPARPRVRTFAVGALLFAARHASAGSMIGEDFGALRANDGSKQISSSGAAGHFITNDGTIDTYQGQPGPCLTLKTTGASAKPASVTFHCAGVTGGVTDLAKLSFGADVWIDRVRPVTVVIASLNDAGKSTGTLTTTLWPPVAGSFYRHGRDLSDFTPDKGAFNPLASRFDVTFQLSAAKSDSTPATLRVDNLSLSSPSFYVSEKGNDSADGRSEATAFLTVQRGIDAAGPGDTVLIMNGEYRNATPAGIARIDKGGSPAKWITLRSSPGQTPRLVNNGWEVFKLVQGAAYIEIRGLDLGGNRKNVKLEDALADGVIKERDGKSYGGDPLFNGNCISAEGRQAPDPSVRPHHLRFINNHVHDNCGGGISAIASDYITIEGNDVHDNAHYMRYGGSGMSILVPSNFDDSTAARCFLLNNVLRNNRGYVPWIAVGKMSDGNGIILDVNIDKKEPAHSYLGRSIVANNLCIGNGGGGITVTTARHVDIVNNTLYHNVQTDDLAKRGWGDLMIGGPPPNCEDVRVFNNIIWAAPGRAIITAGRVNNWTAMNNIYFGDPGAKLKAADAGDSDNLLVDPGLKHPSLDAPPEDFMPTSSSPALRHGSFERARMPPVDLVGTLRPSDGPVTVGAFQQKGQ